MKIIDRRKSDHERREEVHVEVVEFHVHTELVPVPSSRVTSVGFGFGWKSSAWPRRVGVEA